MAMMLGDMLAGLDDENKAIEAILGLGDLQLLAGMCAQAEAEGIDLASCAREAVQRYAAQASDGVDNADGAHRPFGRSRPCLPQARPPIRTSAN
jgi:hypothetical protein